MMPGMIMLWAGSVESIPTGWHLCDGTMGTPDLRNRFIVAAGDTYQPGNFAGGPTHSHSFTSDYFRMDLIAGNDVGSGYTYGYQTDFQVATGDTDPSTSLPPYYALCYIMKIN